MTIDYPELGYSLGTAPVSRRGSAIFDEPVRGEESAEHLRDLRRAR